MNRKFFTENDYKNCNNNDSKRSKKNFKNKTVKIITKNLMMKMATKW
jgi:hypothetical protein